jgi:hypothetical protein
MSAQTIVLQQITRVTPLGIKFWDDATARVMSDGLVVEVYPSGDPERRVAARPNRIGIFVLPRLPGPRDPAFEFGAGDAAFWQRLQPRPHVIEVADRNGFFQPFTVDQPLPVRGLAMPPCLPHSSPPMDAVPLFSTSSRPVPTGMAVLRADLLARVPGQPNPVPASWAVVEVHVDGQTPVRGVADREGRVAVIFPYPEPTPSPARPMSPPYPSGQSLWDQEWPVRIEVFYDPVVPAPLVPDLCRTLSQRPAMAWTNAEASTPLPDQTLRYGQELIVRNPFVTTAGSPP